MTNGFWESGFGIFSSALTRQKKAELAPLKLQLKTAATPAEKAAAKEQLKVLKKQFREKYRDAKYSLFAKK